MKNVRLNLRIVFIILFIAFMIFTINGMHSSGSGLAYNGKADLSKINFKQNELVALDGQWEFYWDRLLMPKDFITENMPQMDSLMKVPGDWHNRKSGTKVYPHHGVATYRLHLTYPSTLKDPALSIKRVCGAFKLYANGQLIAKAGNLSNKPSDFREGYKLLIVDLPKDNQEVELIFQVSSLDYAIGVLYIV